MAGGFQIWAERLRQAEAATRREGLALAAQAGGPLSYPLRLAGSGEAFGGSFADHLVNVILSLERDHLDPLADRLVRVSSGLGQLADETEVAARLEMMGQPPPSGFDLFAALAPFRMWPAAGAPLPAGWQDAVGPRGGYVFIDTDRARTLSRLLRDGGEDLRASWRRLRHALEELCLQSPDALVALARAADEVADEVIHRVEAFEEADRRAASSAHDLMASMSGVMTGMAGLAVRPTTKADWRGAALRRAGIDGKAWDPKKGLLANDKTVVAVWRRYGEFHLARPELQWAGMANLVGPMFYAGWQDLFCLREADRKARAKLISRLLDLPERHPLVRAASKSLTARELKWFEERFLIMQRKIFQDLAWQHEAYLQGGIVEIRRLFATKELNPLALKAWEDIASGDQQRVTRGNEALLRREQREVIQKDYRMIRERHPPVGEIFTRLLTATAESPIPGGKPYRDVVQHMDLPKLPDWPDLPGFLPDLPAGPDLPAIPRGNVAKFGDRWDWIKDDMLPAYRNLDTDRLQDIIETPIAERAEPLRRLPVLEYPGG